jgi:dTDP-4-dehydrorhamnose 3,5-epimerase
VKESSIPGVSIRSLERHEDDRGFFIELFRRSESLRPFRQSNHSHSVRGVLRGLHYHRNQDDLWYFISGHAQVALVDLRRTGETVTEEFRVSGDTPVSVYIPRGVAHGFLALTDVDLIYWVTQEFDASDEYGIAWNDPELAIPWRTEEPILSARDAANEELLWDSIAPFS